MTSDIDSHAQPEWNEDGAVALALQRLRDAHDAASANEAYDQFLWAVGDNEAGTYYPVVLATIPTLAELLALENPWSHRAVVESLIDLCGSFVPEEGQEVHDGVDVKSTLLSEIHALRPLVFFLTWSGDDRAEGAADLIDLIDDQAVTLGIVPADHGQLDDDAPYQPTEDEIARIEASSPEERAAAEALVLHECSEHYRKVARIIGTVFPELERLYPHLPAEAYLMATIERLGATGQIEIDGDAWAMRYSEVRLPQTAAAS